MTCFLASLHQLWSYWIPHSFRKVLWFSIPLLSVSRTKERPVSLREFLRVRLLLVLVWSPCPSSTFPGFTGYPKSCERFSLALHGLRKTKMTGLAFAGTIGLGFAIGEPSLEVASCPLFDMVLCFLIRSEGKLLKWLQENIEKFTMLNKRRRWFHSSRVKLPSVSMSASWFLVSNLDLWFQVDSVEQPSKRNSVGSGHVSHCWTSSFDYHLDDSFVVFKNVQLRRALRRMCVCGYVVQIWHLIIISIVPFSWCLGLGFIARMISSSAPVSWC